MQLAIVLVHYHTPQLLRRAIDALERDAAGTGLRLEGVVVDNGSRPEDRALMEALPFRWIRPDDNLGYAGGVNLGLRSTNADWAVVMNPDVEVLPGCLQSLTETLRRGAAVAGPRFYWDAGRRFQLPPTERVGYGSELGRLLAERSGVWCALMRRRWRHHSLRFFTAQESLASYDLSGALLALRRDAWRQVGPLDEDYSLYFEETDWLQRMKRAGQPCYFVPAAEAVHLYAQSTVNEGRAQEWFLASQRRFRRRVYGDLFARGLESLGSRWRPTASLSQPELVETPTTLPEDARWLEVAASPLGFPAAVRKLEATDGSTSLAEDQPLPKEQTLQEAVPSEIRQRMAPGTYFLRAVAGSGRELMLRRLVVPAHGPNLGRGR